MMVADQFPVFKLVTLLARQLSSPIALHIKKYAVSRPRVGGLLCRRVAQTYHDCEWLARVWTLRLAGVSLPKNARAPPLRDQTAINLGGDLLAHLTYCSKKLVKKSEWLSLMMTLEEIQHEISLQQVEINHLHAALLALQPQQPPTE